MSPFSHDRIQNKVKALETAQVQLNELDAQIQGVVRDHEQQIQALLELRTTAFDGIAAKRDRLNEIVEELAALEEHRKSLSQEHDLVVSQIAYGLTPAVEDLDRRIEQVKQARSEAARPFRRRLLPLVQRVRILQRRIARLLPQAEPAPVAEEGHATS